MLRQDKSRACVHLSELQAYVRLETGDEEALAAGLLRTSTELCEEFIGSALLTRSFEEELTAGEEPRRISIAPVRSVSSVRVLGEADALSPGDYAISITRDGRANVRCARAGATLVVSGTAGMADDSNDVPEPLRQGIIRLAASLFANRDSSVEGLPPIVTALWRPYKRLAVCP